MGRYKSLSEFDEIRFEVAKDILTSILQGKEAEALKNPSVRERMAFLAVKTAESLLEELKILTNIPHDSSSGNREPEPPKPIIRPPLDQLVKNLKPSNPDDSVASVAPKDKKSMTEFEYKK